MRIVRGRRFLICQGDNGTMAGFSRIPLGEFLSELSRTTAFRRVNAAH